MLIDANVGVDQVELEGDGRVKEVADLGGQGFAFGAEEADGMEEEEDCGCEDRVEREEAGEEGSEAGEVDLGQILLVSYLR